MMPLYKAAGKRPLQSSGVALEKLVKKYAISNAHIKFRKGLSHDGAVKVVFGERLGALTV